MNISKDVALTTITFIFFLVVCYFLGFWLIFRMSQATPLMLSVGLATVLTCIVRKKNLASLGWGWNSSKYQSLSYLIPFFIVFSAYIIIWVSGFGEFYNTSFLADKKSAYNLNEWNEISVLIFHIVLSATVTFLISLPSILGEEMGWRGLLVPELSKCMSFTGVAVVSGILWSLFHWPLVLLGLYGNESTPLYYQLLFFTIFITSTGTIMAYLRLKSGSIWTAVIYHASSNVFIQKVFTPLTRQNESSNYYIDEFGAVLAIVSFLVAIYFLRKGHNELSLPQNNNQLAGQHMS